MARKLKLAYSIPLMALVAGADARSPPPSPATMVTAIIMPGSHVSSLALEIPDDPNSSRTVNVIPGNSLGFPVGWVGDASIRNDVRLAVRFDNGDSYVIPLRLRRTDRQVPVPIFQSSVNSCWPGHLSNRVSQSSMEALEQITIASRMYSIQDRNERCDTTAGRRVASKWLSEAVHLTRLSVNFRLNETAVEACRRFRCETPRRLAEYRNESERTWIRESYAAATWSAHREDYSTAIVRIDELIVPVLAAQTGEQRRRAESALQGQSLRVDRLLSHRADYQVLAEQRGQPVQPQPFMSPR